MDRKGKDSIDTKTHQTMPRGVEEEDLEKSYDSQDYLNRNLFRHDDYASYKMNEKSSDEARWSPKNDDPNDPELVCRQDLDEIHADRAEEVVDDVNIDQSMAVDPTTSPSIAARDKISPKRLPTVTSPTNRSMVLTPQQQSSKESSRIHVMIADAGVYEDLKKVQIDHTIEYILRRFSSFNLSKSIERSWNDLLMIENYSSSQSLPQSLNKLKTLRSGNPFRDVSASNQVKLSQTSGKSSIGVESKVRDVAHTYLNTWPLIISFIVSHTPQTTRRTLRDNPDEQGRCAEGLFGAVLLLPQAVYHGHSLHMCLGDGIHPYKHLYVVS